MADGWMMETGYFEWVFGYYLHTILFELPIGFKKCSSSNNQNNKKRYSADESHYRIISYNSHV